MRPKILVILGPTATGKTDLGIILARKYGGEVVACDSRQVYKGLDLGTGKAPSSDVSTTKGEGFWEISGVKVWLYDVADPKVQYNLWNFVVDASQKIAEISREKKLPVIVGGSGLYLKGLLEGLSNTGVGADQQTRLKLEKMPLDKLQEKLQNLSPMIFNALNNSDKSNKRRLIRKIEIFSSTPQSMQSFAGVGKDFDVLKIGVVASREVLNKRIDTRVDKRVTEGMIKEAQRLYKNGLSLERMRQLGLEYGLLADLLEGKLTQNQFSETLKIKIHQFAKRQLTWFKKESKVYWFNVEEADFITKVERFVEDWYNPDYTSK